MENKSIFELIEELCPDGVEFKKLKDISNIKRGDRITKSNLVENGKYLVMSGGTKPMGKYDKKNRAKNTITISSYGSAGYVDYITEDFWANDVCLCVNITNEKEVNKKYLYYALKTQQEYIYGNTTKATPDHIPTEFLETLEIPIPPIEIQEEIVRILDKFTELTVELTAELTARQQQYEYYRDLLLTFKRKENE